MNCVRNNSLNEGRELEMFPPFLLCRGISLFLWDEEGEKELVVRSTKEEGVDL